jgi:hypothetical protein
VPVTVVRLTRSRNAGGGLVVRLGVPLLDEYLEFLAGRCRPNTVLAVAYDLKVFFTLVAKPPRRVRPVDVLAFMTAQRTGGDGRLQVAGASAGVSARTLRRRLSSVSGLYGFLLARGDVAVNPVPRGLPTRRERQRPGQGVPLVRAPRTLPNSGAVQPGLFRWRALCELACHGGGLRREAPRALARYEPGRTGLVSRQQRDWPRRLRCVLPPLLGLPAPGPGRHDLRECLREHRTGDLDACS